MSPKWGAILIAFLSPLLAFAQSAEQSIQTEVELVSVLCRAKQDEQSRELLLKSHPQLVNSQLWSALTSRAVADYYGSSPQQSLATYEIAIQVAGQLHSPRLLATTYYDLGRTYSGLNQLSKAVEAYEKSKELFEQAGLRRDLTYILADLGLLYFIQEDYEKAARYSEQSLAIADTPKTQGPLGAWPDEYGKATALTTLANLNLRDGDYEQAVEKLRTSLALYQQLNRGGSDYNTYIASDLQALGRVYTANGDYTQGLVFLNQALKIVQSLSDADTMANLLNSIGVLYVEQEDYFQAKKNFDESLRVYVSNNNQREAAKVLLNLGVIEQRQSNHEQALVLFRRSLQTAKTAQSVDTMITAGEGIGVVLTAKKEFAAALDVLKKSLGIANETNDRTGQAELQWRSAETYFAMGDYAQAVAQAESAVALARASHLAKLTYLATTTLGQAYAAQEKLELGTQTLKQAVEQLEMMREQVAGSEVESQLFLENKVASYHSLVDLLIKQGKPLDALLCAERAKARVLLDVLRGGKRDVAKVLAPPEKEEAQRLNRRISEINDRLKTQETIDPSSLNSLYARLDAARLEYQSFQDAVFVTHPELNIRSGRAPTIDRSGIDGLARNSDSAYLEYVVSKQRVYLFVLTSTKSTNEPQLKSYSLSVTPEELVRKVDQFHDQLANLNPDYGGNAHELYSLLVAPAAEQLKGVETLCIVPDGVLWNLPFQALMPANEHYLLEDHAIYYAPSLSVLREMSKKEGGGRNANSLIAFGNPVIGKDEQRQVDLCPLPEAENEVGSIAKTAGLDAKRVFIGRDASEKTFKTLAPGFSVIHLATHGVLDNRNPLYSHLLLTRTEGDAENDGLLEAHEIMDMRLDADLAVLSACDTANGKIAPGEGVMGMSWAFFVAGCRSMLVSQWKVNSSSTSQLMVNFYQQSDLVRKRSGGANARALRAASLQLMKDDRYSHPFFWAGFVLVGVNYTQ